MTIRIKRVYDEADRDDGYRVLVDRLWPRGVAKSVAAIDEWRKEIGPSSELRTWFAHVPERFDEFAVRYRSELEANEATDQLKRIVTEHDIVTLVYSAKDEEHNQAVVLADFLG